MPFDAFLTFLSDNNIRFSENEPLSKHTSFKIGGNARVAAFPDSETKLVGVLQAAKKAGLRSVLLGNGSNVLVSDRGFDGVVIFTTECKNVSLNGNIITADCGVTLAKLASVARDASLTGLEFAHGIPGTVGGGVFMNAGAYGGEIGYVLVSSRFYDISDGSVGEMTADAHGFGYRTSVYSRNENLVMLSAKFELKPGNKDEISAKMSELMAKRREKQPIEYPSAGSTFKRPVDNFAGKLIEDAGLKGYTVGGAKVSEKHAGFVINVGGATAEDVKKLISYVKEKVYRDFGVLLECEIKFID